MNKGGYQILDLGGIYDTASSRRYTVEGIYNKVVNTNKTIIITNFTVTLGSGNIIVKNGVVPNSTEIQDGGNYLFIISYWLNDSLESIYITINRDDTVQFAES